MKKNMCDVVILCGGQGTRLREETESKPKPMVEIGGKPILWHVMNVYARHGFGDFLIAAGYKAEPEFNFEVQHLTAKASAMMRRDAKTLQAVGRRRKRSPVAVQGSGNESA